MSRITIEIDGLDAVQRRLAEIARAGQDLTPVMAVIGEKLKRSTQDRFSSQTAPDGKPWPPLDLEYAARKKRNRDKVLTLHGELRGSIAYRAAADQVIVGSNEKYAATHQFGSGDDGRNIPARPFLGLSDDDRDVIRVTVADYLEKALRE